MWCGTARADDYAQNNKPPRIDPRRNNTWVALASVAHPEWGLSNNHEDQERPMMPPSF